MAWPIIKNVFGRKELSVSHKNPLSFSSQIGNMERSAIRMLGFVITQTSALTSIETIQNLYYTLVRSKLEFAFVIWYGEYQILPEEF